MNSNFSDPAVWSRIQFAFTITYHYLFPQLTMGLAWFLVYWKWCALRTGEEKYDTMRRDAFNWFLGNNTLSQVVYDQITGGCYDGVGEKEINLNQGAESTVMYLLARLSFEK